MLREAKFAAMRGHGRRRTRNDVFWVRVGARPSDAITTPYLVHVLSVLLVQGGQRLVDVAALDIGLLLHGAEGRPLGDLLGVHGHEAAER